MQKQTENGQYRQEPATSRSKQYGREDVLMPEEKAKKIIREAENSRAIIHSIQGNSWNLNDSFLNKERSLQYEIDLSKEFIHSAIVDENYHLVGSYVDTLTQEKIVKGE